MSLDYLMKIKDFFNIESSTSSKNVSQSSQKGYNEVVTKKRSPQTSGNTTQMLTVNLHVEKPDIILLEDMDDINSNCILLNVCNLNIISIYLIL